MGMSCDATGLRRKNASALIMFRPCAVPGVGRRFGSRRRCGLAVLGHVSRSSLADGGRCCGFAIFRELIGGTDQTELGLDLVSNLLGDGRVVLKELTDLLRP